ncbi:MAG: HAD hydrolase family protein [Candidatus Lutibacillus vidarii]|jgi:hydroxymethylpyrimidine pyrophosphatase-like HAD family hydrolase|nr:HAD hydrolase family protein [Candidatus Lutibacillus vidarii]HRB98556.1 HAD hydrolase family protein [Dermatophilaceae bacterium]
MTPSPSTVRPLLVATDLDGTLLRSDGSVSARTRAALAATEAAGIPVVFVTARPPRWLDELADVVGGHGVALCGNGAFTYDVHARVVSDVRPIGVADLHAIIAGVRAAYPSAFFAAERLAGFAHEPAFQSIHDVPPGTPVGPIESLLDSPVGKLLARCPELPDDDFLAGVVDVVGRHGIVAYSGAGGLAEISAPGVTKAAVLEGFAAAHGVPRERVWAFGDMPNDLPMLRWAGESYAVANGHPEVLAAARHTCRTNDEDGVAGVLEAMLAGRG